MVNNKLTVKELKEILNKFSDNSIVKIDTYIKDSEHVKVEVFVRDVNDRDKVIMRDNHYQISPYFD